MLRRIDSQTVVEAALTPQCDTCRDNALAIKLVPELDVSELWPAGVEKGGLVLRWCVGGSFQCGYAID